MTETNNVAFLFTSHDICTATQGTCTAATPIAVSGVCIDSRKVSAGDMYIALKGERVDGHDYAAAALHAGAACVMVERVCTDIPATQQIIVNDCLSALQQLAAYHRARCSFKVVGVTGSVGKTTTKEMLALCIGAQRRVVATQGNYNNHIGLPLTLVNVPTDIEIVILEMGMNHAGEISLLSQLARPDAAIITTVDAVHLEFFDSVAGIAHAKAEMMDGMGANAPIILPYDNPYFEILQKKANSQGCHVLRFGRSAQAEYRFDTCFTNAAGTRATIHTPNGKHTLHLQVVGEHLVMNALSVLACVDALGLDSAQALAQLSYYEDTKGRGTIYHHVWSDAETHDEYSLTVLDDSYNASPASMRAAFARLHALAGGEHRTIAALGDMKELGNDAPTFHASLAESLQENRINALFCTGEMMRHLYEAARPTMEAYHFPNNAELATALRNYVQGGDIILCKGSRSSHMEEVVQVLLSRS
jgi:UDP-N-acetylmuramoyl-tripeptide--D-alanyl-D-alanine ligase